MASFSYNPDNNPLSQDLTRRTTDDDFTVAFKIINFARYTAQAGDSLIKGCNYLAEVDFTENPDEYKQDRVAFCSALSQAINILTIKYKELMPIMYNWLSTGNTAAEPGIRLMASLIDLKDAIFQIQTDVVSSGLPLLQSSVERLDEDNRKFSSLASAFEAAILGSDTEIKESRQSETGVSYIIPNQASSAWSYMALPAIIGISGFYIGLNLASAFLGGSITHESNKRNAA